MSEATARVVLVVEDEEIVREIVCMDLADAGFEVIEACSGEEAMALMSDVRGIARKVGLLCTDIRMPGTIDGWTLAEKAREFRPDIPVVYASGYSTEPYRGVPGSEFIAKPYRTSVLLEALNRLGLR